MSWNYRIVHYAARKGYGLHEVHYDADGKPVSMTETPVSFTCWEDEGPGGIQQSLMMACMDALKMPVLEEPVEWAHTGAEAATT